MAACAPGGEECIEGMPTERRAEVWCSSSWNVPVRGERVAANCRRIRRVVWESVRARRLRTGLARGRGGAWRQPRRRGRWKGV